MKTGTQSSLHNVNRLESLLQGAHLVHLISKLLIIASTTLGRSFVAYKVVYFLSLMNHPLNENEVHPPQNWEQNTQGRSYRDSVWS